MFHKVKQTSAENVFLCIRLIGFSLILDMVGYFIVLFKCQRGGFQRKIIDPCWKSLC